MDAMFTNEITKNGDSKKIGQKMKNIVRYSFLFIFILFLAVEPKKRRNPKKKNENE